MTTSVPYDLQQTAGGKVTKQSDYSPFGHIETPDASAHLVPGFSGLFWDEQAGAYLTLRRAYDPSLGRFLEPDPVPDLSPTALINSSNYTYCYSNPVFYVDRDGAFPVPLLTIHQTTLLIVLLIPLPLLILFPILLLIAYLILVVVIRIQVP